MFGRCCGSSEATILVNDEVGLALQLPWNNAVGLWPLRWHRKAAPRPVLAKTEQKASKEGHFTGAHQ
jgi:hypothetical protein